jgi:hypothetical protein
MCLQRFWNFGTTFQTLITLKIKKSKRYPICEYIPFTIFQNGNIHFDMNIDDFRPKCNKNIKMFKKMF